MLEIPGAGSSQADFDRTAIAMGGLLRAEREGHWDFPGGSDALATYLECLSEWRQEIVQKLMSLCAPRDGWDHSAAAAELLAIGSVINGRLRADADQVADVASIFAAEWPTEVNAISSEMKRVYDRGHSASGRLAAARP